MKIEEGGPALKAFLYLLANAGEDTVKLEKWGLSEETKTIVESIDQNQWEIIL